MKALQFYFVLLLFQLFGEVLNHVAHLSMPGPVLGMALLACWFLLRRKKPGEEETRAANGLLSWLGLLFVPAGVGVMASGSLLRAEWLPLCVGLVGSTFLTLLVTAWLVHRVESAPE